ncbi:MAG: hydrogenase expression protein, partial [Chloroflexota bacterium]
GVPAAVIGAVTPPDEGLTLVRDGRAQPLPTFARDELARYLEEQGT